MKNQPADRFNEGKVDHTVHYIPALEAEARVWQKSKKKYPDKLDVTTGQKTPNWHALWGEDTVAIVGASALRHIFALLQGEERDSETGEYHAAHVRCNMAMLIKYYEDQVTESFASSTTQLLPRNSYLDSIGDK